MFRGHSITLDSSILEVLFSFALMKDYWFPPLSWQWFLNGSLYVRLLMVHWPVITVVNHIKICLWDLIRTVVRINFCSVTMKDFYSFRPKFVLFDLEKSHFFFILYLRYLLPLRSIDISEYDFISITSHQRYHVILLISQVSLGYTRCWYNTWIFPHNPP